MNIDEYKKISKNSEDPPPLDWSIPPGTKGFTKMTEEEFQQEIKRMTETLEFLKKL